MPTTSQKDQVVAAAVAVSQAYDRYQRALTRNHDLEQQLGIYDWPVTDLIECTMRSRRGSGLPVQNEDQLLSFFEDHIPDVRQRYANERASRDAVLEALAMGHFDGAAAIAASHYAGDVS